MFCIIMLLFVFKLDNEIYELWFKWVVYDVKKLLVNNIWIVRFFMFFCFIRKDLEKCYEGFKIIRIFYLFLLYSWFLFFVLVEVIVSLIFCMKVELFDFD